LGTWATGLFPHFTLKDEAKDAITGLLLSGTAEKQVYAVKFLTGHLPVLMSEPDGFFQACLIAEIEDGNRQCYDAAASFRSRGGKTWTEPFATAIKEFKPRVEKKVEPDDDGVPF
jgi:hypothetical protein